MLRVMESMNDVDNWLIRNHSKVVGFAGKWIAVSGSGIKASAGTLRALTRKLSEAQKSSLLITRIPTKKEATGLVL